MPATSSSTPTAPPGRSTPRRGPSPDDLAIGADSSLTVRTLLAHLPADQRDIVELRVAGLTGPEIARALKRSYIAIRVGQFRAYSRPRDLIRAGDESLGNRATRVDHDPATDSPAPAGTEAR